MVVLRRGVLGVLVFAMTPAKDKYPTTKDFLAAIKPFALEIESKFGVPWLMMATQAAHESRNGNSKLTVEANNLFGMTGESWQKAGKPVYVIQTKEYDAAHKAYWTARPFRKYADWQESIQDWIELVARHYPKAFACAHAGDTGGFFDGLQEGGYATDPQYAKQLKERYSEIEAIV